MSDPARARQDAIRDQLTAAARRAPDPSRAAQTALGEALVAAARREHAARPRPRPRRKPRWRVGGLLVVGVLGVAAAAEATGLISVGDPLPPVTELRGADDVHAPSALGVDLVATAKDDDRKLVWGVGVYTTDEGADCALPGQVRGRTLGLEQDGTFRPYSSLKSGLCGDLTKQPVILDRLLVRSHPPRSIWYGRTATPDVPIRVSVRGGPPRTAQPGRGGGFLFVFDGEVAPADLRVLER